MMKNLLLVIVLLFSANVFAQELSDQDEKKLTEEIAQMIEVMDLSKKQTKKMQKVKTARVLDGWRIFRTIEQGTFESAAAWKKHLKEFDAKEKAVVSKDQWNLWQSYTCDHCNKAKSIKGQSKKILIKLSEVELDNLNKIVADMTRVMSLYPEQTEAARKIRFKLAEDSQYLWKTKGDGPERDAAFKKLLDVSYKEIKEATSAEQMDMWWAYCREQKNR